MIEESAAAGQSKQSILPSLVLESDTPFPRLTGRQTFKLTPKISSIFRAILEFSAGDFVGKAISFLTFVYLARVLGVSQFGIFEFGNALVMYFLLLGDAGTETWAIREVARGTSVAELASRVTILRLGLSILSLVILIAILPLLPDQPGLYWVMILLGATLIPQALNLKWVFIGQQKMRLAAGGFVLGQAVFAAGVFAFVSNPRQLLLVPIVKLISDLSSAVFFFWRFIKDGHNLTSPFHVRNSITILAPALLLGASSALALVSYNLDVAILGYLYGASSVAWYSAAYKPVTVALAVPMTFFIGLVPAMAGSYVKESDDFERLINHSLRMSLAFAVPIGVGGTMLAEPIILLLFGNEYFPAVAVLQILSWSGVLVIMRGTFRHGLTTANRAGTEVRCALAACVANVCLNLLLIPRFGIAGAAVATVLSELLWIVLVVNRMNRHVLRVRIWNFLRSPLLAGLAMAITLWFSRSLFWMLQASIGVGAYTMTLFLLYAKDNRTSHRD